MSYTLRGRIESRLVAALVPLVAACAWSAAAQAAWPVEVAALMVGIGVTVDALAWDRIGYQPAWAAVPLGFVELGLVVVAARALHVAAPLRESIMFFAGAWLLAQVVAHAVLPLVRLTYASDGGELGPAGVVVGAVALALVAGAAGVARASRPPALLVTGVHGPIVVTRPLTLVGARGAVVRGGVVVRSSDVTLRDLTVEGGTNGITIDGGRDIRLEGVRVRGARLDGIHVRRAAVDISDCTVSMPHDETRQGIDISFAMSSGMSMVRGCTVTGGQQGIVIHTAAVELSGNRVRGTAVQAIAVTEMSMGKIAGNRVGDANGVGIYCGDSSVCEIDDNVVGSVRPDLASGDATRMGYAIEAHDNASATVRDNRARRVRAFLNSQILR